MREGSVSGRRRMEAGAEVLPEARAGDVMREDSGRSPCNCRHDVVVATGRSEKTKQVRSSIAAAGGVVSNKGAMGGCFLACAAVAGRGHGGHGCGGCGAVWKRAAPDRYVSPARRFYCSSIGVLDSVGVIYKAYGNASKMGLLVFLELWLGTITSLGLWLVLASVAGVSVLVMATGVTVYDPARALLIVADRYGSKSPRSDVDVGDSGGA
ncbi:hypothetical protein DEO72_LG8g1433 [Vigna unguiculata]|uniref:Uncharacterized protein n=1 Tax=Vigna unguiculata TaxID=3917 RepID=A0A4D6MTI5_VIGUN|nr:hypothetical protein DEO72_LG8g1433 [Vigna unguiculata]